VLFLAVCLALLASALVTSLQVGMAWAFVGLRAAHSLIHVTYNRVTHRFAVYVASTLCVSLTWGGVCLWAVAEWLMSPPQEIFENPERGGSTGV